MQMFFSIQSYFVDILVLALRIRDGFIVRMIGCMDIWMVGIFVLGEWIFVSILFQSLQIIVLALTM